MRSPLLPGSPCDRARDRHTREFQSDLIATATCPLCRGPLIARYHPARGSYFHCFCLEQGTVSSPGNPSQPIQLQQDQAQKYSDVAATEYQPRRGQHQLVAAHAHGGGGLPQAEDGGHQAEYHQDGGHDQ
jgi:hypothetical protein